MCAASGEGKLHDLCNLCSVCYIILHEVSIGGPYGITSILIQIPYVVCMCVYNDACYVKFKLIKIYFICFLIMCDMYILVFIGIGTVYTILILILIHRSIMNVWD